MGSQAKDLPNPFETAIYLGFRIVCHRRKPIRPQTQMPVGLGMRPLQECGGMDERPDRFGGEVRGQDEPQFARLAEIVDR